jgi:hypothetical protein
MLHFKLMKGLRCFHRWNFIADMELIPHKNCIHYVGGIPLVIVFGDDCQLPSIEPGMLYCCDTEPPTTTVIATRQRLFHELAQNIMKLDSSKRQHEEQVYIHQKLFRQLCAEEHGPWLTEQDAKLLCKLCVNNIQNVLDKKRRTLENNENALFLHANCIPVENHNNECLHRQCSKDNPVGITKAVVTAPTGRCIAYTKHFQRNDIPASTKVSTRAKVQLKNKNIRPSNALYKCSLGKVIDIVFAPGHNSNNGW